MLNQVVQNRMAPIHRGVAIGRKITILGKLAKKIKKKIIADNQPTYSLDGYIEKIEKLVVDLEEESNTWAEDGRASEFIYETQIKLINQLFRLIKE